MTPALRNGTFRKLTALYAVETFIGWFGAIALMVLVYGATGSTAAGAAMLICNKVAPGVIVWLLGSALDRFELRRCLAISLVVQAAAFAVLAALGYGWVLYPLAVVAGTAGSMGRASIRTAVLRTLSETALRGGNAVLNLVLGIAAPVGPAVAAFMVSAYGASMALACAGVLAMALSVFSLRLPAIADAADADPGFGSEAHGTASASKSRTMLSASGLLVIVSVMACVASMDEPALLAYSEESLHAGVSGYGAIFTAWGLGITLGSILFTRLLRQPMLGVAAAATAVMAAAYVGMSVSPSITVTCAISVIGGAANGVGWVAILTAVQEAAKAGEEGRVTTRLEAIMMVGPGLGYILGSAVAELSGPRMSLLVPGVLSLFVLLAALTVVRVRAADRRPSGAHLLTPSLQGGSA